MGLDPWVRNVGMVFQSYALWPHLRVRDNVAFGLKERRVQSEQITSKVDAALELVDLADLGDLGDRMPNQLSGGQQQRIALSPTFLALRIFLRVTSRQMVIRRALSRRPEIF